MTFKNKTHAIEWKRLFETEHANALISDGFWYVICKVFKKGKQTSAQISAGIVANINQQPMVLAASAGSTYDAFGQPVTYESY